MFAPLAPLAPRSCARLGDRSRLLRVPARLKSFPRKSDLELCAGRCKNQWKKLAGRNKRAAASEPSKAKRAKLSPAAPSLAKPQPVRATELCCDRCGAWYPTSEIGVSAEVASLMDFVCGVCKGTHKPV